MRQVIDGKWYDTETAHKIGEHAQGGQMDGSIPSLYVTTKGQHFASHYPDQGKSWLELLPPGAALAWAEENQLDATIIERRFDIEEG